MGVDARVGTGYCFMISLFSITRENRGIHTDNDPNSSPQDHGTYIHDVWSGLVGFCCFRVTAEHLCELSCWDGGRERSHFEGLNAGIRGGMSRMKEVTMRLLEMRLTEAEAEED